MFKGALADMCAALVNGGPSGGPSGGSTERRHGSEDPHRREGKFTSFLEIATHLYFIYVFNRKLL